MTQKSPPKVAAPPAQTVSPAAAPAPGATAVAPAPTPSGPASASGSAVEADHEAIWVEVIDNTGDVLAAAAWPVAAVVVALLLRKEIAGLINRLKHLKLGGFEASVDEQIRETLADAEPAPAPAQVPPALGTVSGLTTSELLTLPPIEGIITSWRLVERALSKAYRAQTGEGGAPVGTMLRQLKSANVLPNDLIARIRELQLLRNRVVHETETDLSPVSVRLYAQSALDAARQLGEIAEAIGPGGVPPADEE